METRDDILKELRDIAPRLLLVEKVNPYTVPQGYFLNFQHTILEKIKLNEAKEELKATASGLAEVKKHPLAGVPFNYFSGFSDRIVGKIRVEEVANELAEIAPALSKLEKLNVFEAPADYFNSLSEKIFGEIRQQQKSAAASEPKWWESLNNIFEQIGAAVFKPKYSFAFAGIATTVIIGVMLFMKVQQCNDLDCKLAQLSTEEINNYLDNKSDSYSDEVFEMSGDEKSFPALNNVHPYNDALKEMDDAALDSAIAD